jgi:hypothetical protein
LQAKVTELKRNTEVEKAARIPSVCSLSLGYSSSCPIRLGLINRPLQAERNATLAHLDGLQAELSKLQAELNAYGQCNPEQAEMKRRATELAKEAALRWTGEPFGHFQPV